ncbi:hypothetical protein [Planobispora takensis]|uniref:Lipoprotein n=1 Tax=Planobispora takensis TaxID=1367882 RepID=A0A8J3SWQ4_9ACTN|nr:hypothetical protein [Planobispora takensis]GII01892.1 hypothetical protein Pta02_39000 [Planobispora takensis]
MFRTVALTAGAIVIALSSLVACTVDDEACAASASGTAIAPFAQATKGPKGSSSSQKPKTKKKVDVDIDDCD